MINIYNWSYEIEKNLVRIEFGCTIKTKVQNIIQQFNGQQLSIAMGENVLIVNLRMQKLQTILSITLFLNIPIHSI